MIISTTERKNMMNMKRVMMIAAMAAILGAGFVPSACAAVERPVPPSVVVESVKFRQRYPWNGLVDIDAKIWCSNPTTNLAVYVAAWDNVKDRALKVKTVWVDGDETKNPDLVTKSGTARIVWDARADNPNEVSQNVSVSVQAYVRDMRYLVIDISDGANATDYACTFMPDPPEGGWTDEYKTNKLVMRFIPAGTFWMGSPEDEVGRWDDEKLHRVTLTEPFYIAIFETTQRQYELVVGGRPSLYNNDEFYMVRPIGAQRDWARGHSGWKWPLTAEVSEGSFVGLLRLKTGMKSFDLPTESRWEYACRAGTDTAFNDGSNMVPTMLDVCEHLDRLARYNTLEGSSSSGISYGTAAVGSYKPNNWGLYDMHGNVSEWCLDGGVDGPYTHEYPLSPVYDPKGEAAEYTSSGAGGSGWVYILRGGDYCDDARCCRSAFRRGRQEFHRGNDYNGFRICCDASFGK